MKIQINTLSHRGAFSFSLPKPWKVAAAQRDISFATSPWAWGGPSPEMRTPHDANSEASSTLCPQWPLEILSAVHSSNRLLHCAQSPTLYSAKRATFWPTTWSYDGCCEALDSPSHLQPVI